MSPAPLYFFVTAIAPYRYPEIVPHRPLLAAHLAGDRGEGFGLLREGLVFLPYLNGERTPHPDPFARGAFFGLSARHGLNELCRAVMEGVSFGLRDSLEILDNMGVKADKMLLTGGGAKSAFWRQLLADVYARPLSLINSPEGPALGVAILAGVGAGVYQSVESACDALVRPGDAIRPDTGKAAVYQRFHRLYQQLYPALKQSWQELARL